MSDGIDAIIADPHGYIARARANARAAADAEVARRINIVRRERKERRSAEIDAMPRWYRWIVRWWEAPRWQP